ncbi:hypothetical protein AB0M39_24375 [Streptomyces sp. NPDC051907]|uniref:hypothetical protein n=1 Tax=Streptomyces sp. NPDC051907 TaxID=3155284 RepID=UPI00342B1F32
MNWRWGRKSSRAEAEEAPPQVEVQAEEPVEQPVAQQAEPVITHPWGERGEQWKPWLQRSQAGVDLFVWWTDPGNHIRSLVGEARYCEHLVELLSRASPRDCAALGLGCTRRTDRSCREPETCRLDPVERTGAELRGRTGPIPGACDSFWDCWTPYELNVDFTDDERHRAVHLRDDTGDLSVRLWVDGVPVAQDIMLERTGHWLDDRFYVVEAEGPEDHPEQRLAFGQLACHIISLVVHDAERAATQVFVPGPQEIWTDPRVRRDGDTLRLYADLAAAEADRPDRVVPAAPPSP